MTKPEELRVDMRQTTPEESEKWKRQTQLVFELNHTMPYTDTTRLYRNCLKAISAKMLRYMRL